MELIFLGNISNIDSLNNRQITLNNNHSLKKFNMCIQIFSELGDSECMLSNIEEMENELKNLTDYGYLEQGSTRYRIMEELKSDALDILVKCQTSSNISLDAIYDFYTIRQNHKNMVNLLNSDSSDGSV